MSVSPPPTNAIAPSPTLSETYSLTHTHTRTHAHTTHSIDAYTRIKSSAARPSALVWCNIYVYIIYNMREACRQAAGTHNGRLKCPVPIAFGPSR